MKQTLVKAIPIKLSTVNDLLYLAITLAVASSITLMILAVGLYAALNLVTYLLWPS